MLADRIESVRPGKNHHMVYFCSRVLSSLYYRFTTRARRHTGLIYGYVQGLIYRDVNVFIFSKNRIKTIVFKTVVIRFLKVQNEWVVFKNDCFYPKTKRSLLKTIGTRNKKRSFNDRFQKRLTGLIGIQDER